MSGYRKICKDEDTPRFEMPKASVTYDRHGRPVYGIVDMPSRPLLSIDFEKVKAAANASAMERPLCSPNGPRMEARKTLETEWARRQREAEEQQRPSLRSAGPIARYLKTSPENPLSSATTTTTTTTSDTDPQPTSAPGAAAAAGEKGILKGSKSQLPYSLQAHLGPGLVPLPAPPRPHLSRGGVGAPPLEREQRQFWEEGEGEEEWGCSSPSASCSPSPAAALPPLEVQEVQLEARWGEAQALRAELCRQYPHGVPRHVLSRLRCEDEVLLRLMDLPSLRTSYADINMGS
ncbi:hypothetical protein Agub_g13437 [Astrephomene gubernaculifera]|uniref:Uncharacterized protein n=1 Tax=Astrephomene gubernaculifera TaxID=47775 RepID=A0AAD3E1E0_9CHLO|nr:hypothetical protein Agub_g13437 [Astrephomene gubernaculifera]